MDCDFCESKDFKIIRQFPSWDLIKCNDCGLRFGKDKSNRSRNFIKIYNYKYYNSSNSNIIGYSNYSSSEYYKKKTFNKYFEFIEKYVSPGDYLDIGCAYGYSIEIASSRNWKSEGLDISDFACKTAKKRTNKIIYHVDFLNSPIKKKYDLISAWDVLEHTTSPDKFFNKFKRNIKKGGIIALTTPNSSSLIAILNSKKWFEYKWPEHLFYLSNYTLRKYCKRYQFKIIKLNSAIKYKPLGDALCRWLGFYENKNILKSNLFKKPILYSSFCESFLIAESI